MNARAPRRYALEFTAKETRIVMRALLKFTTTSDDYDNAPETNEEIEQLYEYVRRFRRERGWERRR